MIRSQVRIFLNLIEEINNSKNPIVIKIYLVFNKNIKLINIQLSIWYINYSATFAYFNYL